MKILYDHQMFLRQKYGGITKYFCELMKNLPADCEYELSVLLSDNQHLKDDHCTFKKMNVPIADQDFPGKFYLKRSLYHLNQIYSHQKIAQKKYDLLHPTYYDPYFLKDLQKPYVITVHDLIDFKFPDYYEGSSIKPRMEKIIRNANRIISISQNTKKDLIEIFQIDPAKIDVIYHGFRKMHSQQKANSLGRYILFVGRRENYKNFKVFAKAASVLLNKEEDLKLICVGDPFRKDEKEHLKSLKILDQSIAMGVNEKRLNELYSHALVFVYPTLYEGFGMPVLEAFANDCPVCLSDTSSLPEIAGDAAVYFDPNDLESIVHAISSVVYNCDFSKKMVLAGQKRLTGFSWEKCARETAASYKTAIS